MRRIYAQDPGGEGTGIGFEEFQDRFIAICTEHREKNRALAFAFILYDFRKAEIINMLETKGRYWKILNDIAAELLTIFLFDVGLNIPDVRKHSEPEPMAKMMVSVSMSELLSERPRARDRPDKFVRENFVNVDIESLGAAVLFFQVHDGKILDSKLVGIPFVESKKSFAVLCNLLSGVTERIKELPDAYDDSQRIWDLMNDEIDRSIVTRAVILGAKLGLAGVTAVEALRELPRILGL